MLLILCAVLIFVVAPPADAAGRTPTGGGGGGSASSSSSSSAAGPAIRDKSRGSSKDVQEIIAIEGVNVILRCLASDNNSQQAGRPTIVWNKVDAHMPHGRSQILDDQGLLIRYVTPADEGIYACRAENAAGNWQESLIQLIVHMPPSLTVRSPSQTVGVGRRVVFRCEATGHPLPAVFWNKDATSQMPQMFPNQDNGRVSVTDDGTMSIDSVQMDDAGEYSCRAYNAAGTAIARAFLTVTDVDPRLPPVIQLGPHNTTAFPGGKVVLPCSVAGDPPPSVQWYRDGTPLSTAAAAAAADTRVLVASDSGSLHITDLRLSDSAIYTCKASSELGEAVWSAALNVVDSRDASLDRSGGGSASTRRRPEMPSLPRVPSRPVVSDVAETSVTLTWKANAVTSLPADSFVVEYFSHDAPERGWVVASDSVTNDTFTVRGLRPDTTYIFLVRSRNMYGLSLPSRITPPVRTKGGVAANGDSLSPLDVAMVSERLSGQVISLLQPQVVNSTSIKLTWQVHRSHKYIEGVRIKYRALPDPAHNALAGQSRRARRLDVMMTSTVPGGASVTSFTLTTLHKYTWYELCVLPYYKKVDGQESNWVRARTHQDVPSSAPTNILASMTDNETLYLSWEQPAASSWNGPALLGYKIDIYNNESGFRRALNINDSSTTSVYIHNLIDKTLFSVRLAAYNGLGEGTKSDVIVVGDKSRAPAADKDPSSTSVLLGSSVHGTVRSEPWLVVTLVAVLGCTMWIAMCLFGLWLCKRRRQHKKIAGTLPISEETDNKFGYFIQSLNLPNYLQVNATGTQPAAAAATAGIHRSSYVRHPAPDSNSSCVAVPVATVTIRQCPATGIAPAASVCASGADGAGRSVAATAATVSVPGLSTATGMSVAGKRIRIDLTAEASAYQPPIASTVQSLSHHCLTSAAVAHQYASVDNHCSYGASVDGYRPTSLTAADAQSQPPSIYFPPPPLPNINVVTSASTLRDREVTSSTRLTSRRARDELRQRQQQQQQQQHVAEQAAAAAAAVFYENLTADGRPLAAAAAAIQQPRRRPQRPRRRAAATAGRLAAKQLPNDRRPSASDSDFDS